MDMNTDMDIDTDMDTDVDTRLGTWTSELCVMPSSNLKKRLQEPISSHIQ